MADVRALLRQQRAARRIEHPHATYSDGGKLMCTVCDDYVKTESLWDSHLRSAGHRQQLQRLHQASAKNGSNGYAGFVEESSGTNGAPGPSHKRKLSDSDETMADQDDDLARRKRAKPDSPPSEQSQKETSTPAKKDDSVRAAKPLTPPLARRTSGTPTAGVEMQIPSRPATPSTGGTPMATTPKVAPVGRSPLIPDEATVSQQEAIRGAPPISGTSQPTSGGTTSAPPVAAAVPVDEDEWAAFEADLVHGGAGGQTNVKPAAAAALDSDAVISAPVMSAAEVAAKSEEEEREKRRALVDIQIEDEKEEATRALETEFDVMEELEARARKLRERREALRLQSNSAATPAGTANGEGKEAVAPGKENAEAQEDEDEEEEDDEDDWDGFRFRA